MKSSWQLEKKVPVALLMTLLFQLVAVVAWASYLEARVSKLEQDGPVLSLSAERLARMEERLDAVRQDVGEIKADMRRLVKHSSSLSSSSG